MAGGQKTKDWIRIKIISMGAAETGKVGRWKIPLLIETLFLHLYPELSYQKIL